MKNEDLIAFLQPIPNRFRAAEWRDATGTIQDINSDAERLSIRTHLPAGIYRGEIITQKGAFDMQTANIEMIRAPDGVRVPFGPWDLDHINNVMAIPMALVTVNGRFRSGLWFAMPGPQQIADGVLTAGFGFEHEGGNLELELALSERDRVRLSWDDLYSFELRRDDRRTIEWKPKASQRPRFFTAGLDRKALAERLQAHEGFPAIKQLLDCPVEEWELLPKIGNEGLFDLACVMGYATADEAILTKAKQMLLTLCKEETWSGRPNPLLMGGDNDRKIGSKLALVGVGWEFLKDNFTVDERMVVLSKAEEYLGKLYDFTLLQREYMGCPTPNAHSQGTWWGVGVACMAFYDELPIARKALPFFHALMVDSLSMFPASGKSPWVTFYPTWPARYFAAAIEFGGQIREVDDSPFLNHLAGALLASFRSPNSQEMQRGLRTVEHRLVSAFLNAFHATPPIASIYAAFVEEERRQAGDVRWTLFDFLYAPVEPVEPALFPHTPFLARDIGDVIVTAGPKQVNIQINAGNQRGAMSSFRSQVHNREHRRSMGDFILSVDGNPVIIKLQGSYGIFSAQRNALCFEEGCLEGEGQYLNGDIPPERCSFIRKFCWTDRFVYTDVNLTPAIQSKLNIHYAQRSFLVDRKTGVILVHDAWESADPLKVGTHLHCSGKVHEEGPGCYRLTGGQANAIAGIKGGDKGLTNDERGDVRVQVLDVSEAWHVQVEEPVWFPAYIYGLNGVAGQRFEDACYPKLQQWRLALNERARSGHIFFALTTGNENIGMKNGQAILPEGVIYHLNQDVTGDNWNCTAEAVVDDQELGQVMAIGVTRWAGGSSEIVFRVPVDICCNLEDMTGTIHSPTADAIHSVSGFEIGASVYIENHPRSLFTTELSFQKLS